MKRKKDIKRKKDEYISLKEAAKLSGYSSDYIGYLIRTKKIKGKSISLGKTWVINPETVLNYKIKKKKEKKIGKNLKIKKFFWSKKLSRFLPAFKHNFSEGLHYALPSVLVFLIIGISALVIYAFPKKEQKIEVFPTVWSLQSNGGTEWQNPHNVLILDLSNNSDLNSFNSQNSAFIKLSDTLNLPDTLNSSIFSEKGISSVNTTTIFLEGVKEMVDSEETISSPQEGVEVILPTVDGEMPGQQETSQQETSDKGQEEVVIFTEQASLIVSSFSLPKEDAFDEAKEIQKMNVNFSFASQGRELENDQVLLEWSLDNQSWNNLVTFNQNQEYSNALNFGFFSFSLPADFDWQEINNLKIRVSYLTNNNSSERLMVYLDAVWLELIYDEKKEEEPKINKLSSKRNFQAREEPEFDFRYNKKEKNILFSFVDSIEELIGAYDFWEDVNLTIEIKNFYNELNSEIETEVSKKDNGDFSVKIKKPLNLKPGLYKIILKIEEDGDVKEFTQDFIWGVLAINVNKSIYVSGEQAYLQMAALADNGDTICDSNLLLEITAPDKSVSHPEMQRSGLCGPNNVVDIPDYFSYYQTGELGIYDIKLTNLDNGYEITDSFEVWQKVPFEVERIGPTRIYPPADYQMTIKVKANQDFNGQIIEQVPACFEITGSTTWDVDWQAGQIYELSYQFDAPDISPYVYFLGLLEFRSNKTSYQSPTSITSIETTTGSNDGIVFSDKQQETSFIFAEARQWQIVSDMPVSDIRPDSDSSDGYTNTFNTGLSNECAAANQDCWDSVNDDAESHDNDTSYVVNDDDATNASQYFTLDNMPSDFVSMDSLNIDVVVKAAGARDDDQVTLYAQIFESEEGAALTNQVTICQWTNISTSSYAKATQPFTLQGNNNKTVWDGAVLLFTWGYSKSKGPDYLMIRITAIELDGEYSPANITISGYMYEDVTPTKWDECDGSTPNVKISVEDDTTYTTTCNADTGYFSVADIPEPAANKLISVYMEGETEDGVSVTLSNGENVSILVLMYTKIL